MLTSVEEKKQYFNRYWQTRDLASADARSIQRAEYVASLLSRLEPSRVLDVGCGRGTVLSYLSRQGYNIEGCDLATDTITSLTAAGHDVFIFDIDTDDLPRKYGAILCLEVLQQVFDPMAALGKFSKALENDGVLIVSVPNEFHLWARIKLLFGMSHLGHFDESHIRLFTPARALDLFRRVGLTAERVIPVSVIPPGNKIFNWIGKMLAHLSPSLFSISQIYRLRIR